MATVIGPTPPGTGVIHEATSLAVLNSTSPTNRLPDLRVLSTKYHTKHSSQRQAYEQVKDSLSGMLKWQPEEVTPVHHRSTVTCRNVNYQNPCCQELTAQYSKQLIPCSLYNLNGVPSSEIHKTESQEITGTRTKLLFFAPLAYYLLLFLCT
jgi:hypothetical protein